MKKRVVLLALGLLGVSSGDVTAQTAVQSFDELVETVTPGNAPGGTRIQVAPAREAGIGIAATIGF